MESHSVANIASLVLIVLAMAGIMAAAIASPRWQSEAHGMFWRGVNWGGYAAMAVGVAGLLLRLPRLGFILVLMSLFLRLLFRLGKRWQQAVPAPQTAVQQSPDVWQVLPRLAGKSVLDFSALIVTGCVTAIVSMLSKSAGHMFIAVAPLLGLALALAFRRMAKAPLPQKSKAWAVAGILFLIAALLANVAVWHMLCEGYAACS